MFYAGGNIECRKCNWHNHPFGMEPNGAAKLGVVFIAIGYSDVGTSCEYLYNVKAGALSLL
jgi:hypothetical protein